MITRTGSSLSHFGPRLTSYQQMGASTAAYGQFREPFSPAGSNEDAARRGCAERLRTVVVGSGLTVARLSAITRQFYGKDSQYFISPTLLSKLNRGISPHVCQLAALSAVTGHSFVDSMNICGFDMRLIFPAQLWVHSERTVLVTPGVAGLSPEFPPFSLGSECSTSIPRYLFARIGSSDGAVSPQLVPGSVVRVDRCFANQFRGSAEPANEAFWLVEHTGGLTCCRLQRVGREHVVFLPHRPPFSAWPLRLQTEARILGIVDGQVHPRNEVTPLPAEQSEKFKAFSPCDRNTTGMSFSRLLRLSRSRVGLTLRAAHAMTITVAQLLGDKEYRIALGLLSDYEASDKLPRHIAKIITLCIIYCIDFWELLRTNGIGGSARDKFLPVMGAAHQFSLGNPREFPHRPD